MERLWTIAEAAQCLGVSEGEIEELAQQGRLTGYQLGGKFLRFRPAEVQALKGKVSRKGGRPGGRQPASQPRSWQERAREFVYFYDFYLISYGLLGGIAVYLMSSG